MSTNGTLPNAPGDIASIAARIWGGVAAEANIAPIDSDNLSDKQLLFELANMKLWAFDAASMDAPVPGSVVKPNDVLLANPGRWKAPVAGTVAAAYKTQTTTYEKDTDDALAADLIAERPFWRAQVACTILGVFADLNAGIVASDIDFVTWNISRYNALGAAKTTIVEGTTETIPTGGIGSVTAFAPISLGALSASAMAAGDGLSFEQKKDGAGKVVGSGAFIVAYLQT